MLKKYFLENQLEAGCDEVGRGCLAGPLVAAAVILPKDYQNFLLNDSKQLTVAKRLALEPDIKNNAIAWAIGTASHQEIDRYNVLQASYLAMHRAIKKMFPQPTFLLIDGKGFKPYIGLPHQCIVKGDSIFASIAAASILAKNFRDAYMKNVANQYPYYGWERNVGYPTIRHRKAIQQHGLSPLHRLSFKVNLSF